MNDLYNLHDVIRSDVEKLLMDVHTSIPARVISYDSTKQTCTVKVVVNRPTQEGANIPAGTYHDVQVQFQAGSKWVIAGPLEADDIVLLVIPHYGTKEFMSGERTRTGDAEYVSRHDINDAIAIPGMFTRNSVTRKAAHKDKFHIANGNDSVILIDGDKITVQVGSTVFEVSATGVAITGNLIVTGNVTAVNMTSSGTLQGAIVQTPTVGLATHTHPFTDTGTGAVGASTTSPGIG